MPCIIREPTQKELKENEKRIIKDLLRNHYYVLQFLNEVGETGIAAKKNEHITNKAYKENSKKLCSICQKINVNKYSFELQIWWERHQLMDRRNLLDSYNKMISETSPDILAKKKEEWLSNLSDYEKKLINKL